MTWLLRTINWHRRSLAAVLAALGVLALVAHFSDGDTGEVAITAGVVAAGSPLSDSDVALRSVPRRCIPAGALTDPADAVGLSAAVTLPDGTMLTPELLITGTPPPEGRSLVPITIPDEQLRDLLVPGLKVALVSAGDVPGIVTTDAVMRTMPHGPATTFSATRQSGLALVEVPTRVAPEVSMLGQSGQLSVFLGG